MSFVAWKLWDEFAWAILRLVSADLKMRQRYLNYQIYVTLLKFGFFYYLGFTIQFLVIVRGRNQLEVGLTAAALPVTIITLFMAGYCMDHEHLAGMVGVLGLFFAGLAYFTFKITRLYSPAFSVAYIAFRQQLSGFAILTLIVLVVTIVYACLCMSAFGKGLKHFVNRPIIDDDLDDGDDAHDCATLSAGEHRSGQAIEMVSNLRARSSGYRFSQNRG